VRREWHVDEAADGGQALDLLLRDLERGGDGYDLVVSDLRMPGVSGVALHDRLAAHHPAMLDRLIFSTGDLVSPEASAFVARTACPVLEKPFRFSALDELVERLATR
jgi:DNA-binding NtrC family response regulator